MIKENLVWICIEVIDLLTYKLQHRSINEAADRDYIYEYIKSVMPYIQDNPSILEFDGGIVYAKEIIAQKGGKVYFATKTGRMEKNNNISYEFDIRKETINRKFDVIIATQFLGSFVEPCMVVQRLKDMLKPHGILILTVSGPSYPSIKGLVSFYTKEGLTSICRGVFGVKNVKNIKSYGDIYSAVCMMNYISNSVFRKKEKKKDKYRHEVISGAICVNEEL